MIKQSTGVTFEIFEKIQENKKFNKKEVSTVIKKYNINFRVRKVNNQVAGDINREKLKQIWKVRIQNKIRNGRPRIL